MEFTAQLLIGQNRYDQLDDLAEACAGVDATVFDTRQGELFHADLFRRLHAGEVEVSHVPIWEGSYFGYRWEARWLFVFSRGFGPRPYHRIRFVNAGPVQGRLLSVWIGPHMRRATAAHGVQYVRNCVGSRLAD